MFQLSYVSRYKVTRRSEIIKFLLEEIKGDRYLISRRRNCEKMNDK